MKLNEDILFEKLEKEYSIKIEGWNFSYLIDSGRMQSFPLSWNYQTIIEPYYRKAKTLLDVGTGGGEFLSALEGLPKNTFATEGYAPNVLVAQKKLSKHGIEVRQTINDILPFDDIFFDVIINRHASYSEIEIQRVLTSNGFYITQQVGGLNTVDLNMWLGSERKDLSNWCLNTKGIRLEEVGFVLECQKECITKDRFYDIGAVIYYLKYVPWIFEDFSIKKYWERIYKLAQYIEDEGYVDFIQHRYLLIARK